MAGTIHCPQCEQNIDQDFGVVICSGCGSVVMIDIDGNVKLAKEISESTSSTAAESAPQEPPQQPPQQAEYQDLQFENSAVINEPQVEVSQQLERETAPSEPDEDQTVVLAAPHDVFTDVIQFANSDLSQGPLKYTVIIEKIDSGELRTKLKEVIGDSRMKLNVDQLMKEIQKGKLEIKNLNPVKATLIVQRLRETDLEISWRQYAFTS